MLIVTHVSDSSLAGTKQTFDSRRVRVGRKPECEVRFDSQRDISVSGDHAEVRVESGRILVRDLGSTNGTFLGEQRLQGETVVGPDDVVRLGANGPRLRFALGALTAETFVETPGVGRASGDEQRGAALHGGAGGKQGVGMETLHRVVGSERAKARRSLGIAGGSVLVVALALAGWQYLRQADTERTVRKTQDEVEQSRLAAEEARELAARTRTELDRTLADVRTRHAEELAALKGELSAGERKVSSLIVEIEGSSRALAEMQAKSEVETAAERELRRELEAKVQTLGEDLAQQESALREQAGKAAPDWAGLVSRYQQSLFLCLAQTAPDANGSFSQSIGTAWVCRADGVLATNAHVAEFMKDRASWSLIACVQNDTGRLFEVREILLHPGYTGRPDSPDVALMRLDTQGVELVPLALADSAELRALRIGTQLGTLGYPGELTLQYVSQQALTGELTTAQATFKDGWIGRILDFQGARAGFEQSHSIQHSASLSGGTSGSPMFTADGKVVALNNAGRDLMVKVQARSGTGDQVERMPNPAEIGYAVRVDLLAELLRDSGW
ncbi:MAG: trypsin-like peptidase domain-containing protein [Planctomycetes bacterium]|nr:trypsin-like peptidase domain-containing protein [Planctomycetota bacterium]